MNIHSLIVTGLLAAASTVHGATVLVDFASVGGSSPTFPTGDTNGNAWTTISAAGTAANLVDTTNAGSGISLNVTFSPTSTGFGGAAFNNTDPGTTVPGLLNQGFATGDGVFANNGTTGFVTLSLTGLAANSSYAITVYGGRNTSWTSGSAAIQSGDGTSTLGTYGNRQSLTFTILADNTGAASFRFTEQGGTNTADSATLNAMSITAVPEPSAALLGSLAVLGLLRRRR
ncbi:PEP-CTERM sorting domain-containing protein [Luteolibacter sp. LG18]|uniref:PEP-CTERM sorting domain-containing protein n=1 Tax=Luteolibacter sp. LG18 TaxID=2819286 RepID=UPI002B2E05DF|nr:hypothetical protein llg_45640 [Luteolibacter sp. LG18]